MSNQPVQAEGGLGDRVKVACAVVAILAGIVGFYLLAGKPTLTRVGVLVAGLVVGAVLAFLRQGANSLHLQKNLIVKPERSSGLRVTMPSVLRVSFSVLC